MRGRRLFTGLFRVTVVALLAAPVAAQPPGAFEWSEATPESRGMSSGALEALREGLAARRTAALLVIRRDAIVLEWYAPEHGRGKRHYSASLAKALVGGTSLMLALADGRLAVDDPASKFIPEWKDDPARSRITIRHLATHSSGIEDAETSGKGHLDQGGWKEAFWRREPDPFTIARDRAPVVFEPGTRYAYSNPGMAMLSWAVTASYRGTGHADLRALLRERIMEPIGIGGDEWSIGYGRTYEVDGLGLVANWGGGAFTARAAARIGRLMLRRGEWEGRRLVDATRVDRVVAYAGAPFPDRPAGNPQPASGLGWWTNADGAWPSVPRDAFAGAGAGNQLLLVVPSLDLIAVRNGGVIGDPERGEGFWGGLETYLFEPLMAAITDRPPLPGGFSFPPPGESPGEQERRRPEEVGLESEIVERIAARMDGNRWALWRHGFLVHVEGEFNRTADVASLRKTWHALAVGAALRQGRIPSIDQPISAWNAGLEGKHARATWRHVISQTSAFDYPYGDRPPYEPGRIWTYSDKNPRQLCDALARVWGRNDFRDRYDDVIRRAYFEAIGLRGWKAVPQQDGVRFHLDLEDMGRLGLLVLARGRWREADLVPRSFVEALESKQTFGVPADYDGPDDGKIGLDAAAFPESPYGFMTWVNTDGDFYPGADRAWAWGAGAGGSCVLWNRRNGVVFAGFGVPNRPSGDGIPHAIERSITGPNPLVAVATPSPSRAAPTPGTLVVSLPRADAPRDFGRVGRAAKWAPIEIAFIGPGSRGRGSPNPFGVELDVTFAPSGGGRRYRVPGFYDGDGRGGLDGTVWKVRFAADEEGGWTFRTSSAEPVLDGHRGAFAVSAVPGDAAGLWRWGRLEATGTRYLAFRDGPHWLKAGCDDPENFLGRAREYDTPVERRAAIDFLAERGINSLYVMTHNLEGDDRDVWPWLGETEREAKENGAGEVRFDVARLETWRGLFEHMQTRVVVAYLVLEDDSAWKGYDHARYYREMVARFGDLPGLIFNFGEEHNENYRLGEALEWMASLAEIDPYDHPRGVHNVNRPRGEYIDAPQVDFTSIQTGAGDPLEHNRLAIEWLERCRERGRRGLVIGFDEGRPEEDRRAWWSAYLGGAVWEAHIRAPYDRPPAATEPVWTELGGARAFMESLPFPEMEPRNDLVLSGKAFCLAQPGVAYALYLPEGGEIAVELAELGPEAAYECAWWDPANGRDGRFDDAGRVAGGERRFEAPAGGDRALRIVRIERAR